MDEQRILEHKKALELLKKPGFKEFLRKDINLKALKKWQEAREPFVEDEEILGIHNRLERLQSFEI